MVGLGVLYANGSEIAREMRHRVIRDLLAVRWTPKTGPLVKLCGPHPSGVRMEEWCDGEASKGACGGVQGQGVVDGGERGADGEQAGESVRGAPDADSRLEEAAHRTG